MSSQYFDVIEHKVLSSYVREYPGATLLNQDEKLYIPVKQYATRNPNSKIQPVTIIAAASVGTAKEAYEPIWEVLHEQSSKLGFSVSSIWIADPVNQAQGEVINGGKLGDDPSWIDLSRDLFLMINQFRDQMPRPFIGIGHSAGGVQLADLAFMHPRLFSSLILLDPTILKTPPTAFRQHPVFHKYILNRQQSWPSRSQAEASIAKWPTYSTWDQRCLQRFLEHSLLETSEPNSKLDDPPVSFSTSEAQGILYMSRQALVNRQTDGTVTVDREHAPDLDPIDAARDDPLYRPEMRATWNRLPELRPSAKFILGGRTYSSTRELNEGVDRCGSGLGGSGGVAEGRVSKVVFKKGSHFFPLEMVDETAAECAIWIHAEVERWIKKEQEFNNSVVKRLENGERVGQEFSPAMRKLLNSFAPDAVKSKI
ncbi:alpha/beta-hydrolase [Penicillium angulare]|uniref:alpha/beta-hydrolase n=1 Tax=Penicillium angulare TaxID=116970 RepID=UPI0025400CB7|nr:alpha/beta-hydrolase [Penicillium angulare]KAJ5272374.1 alpha/beta-hydrolase [Penicillium angulare]